jgi:DNA-binding CsgD family transcriptional regulator
VQDLETVVDAAGLERFSLLGISQGGPIAIAYAVRHPERVSRLVLYGTYACGHLKRNPTPMQVEERKVLLDIVKVGWGRETAAFRQVFSSLFFPDGSPEQLRWFNELQRESTSPGNAVRMMRAFWDLDVRDVAPKVHVPTLVLHAREDGRIPFEEGRRVAAMIRTRASFPSRAGITCCSRRSPRSVSSSPRWTSSSRPTTSRGAARQRPPPSRSSPTARPRCSALVARGLGNSRIAERLRISEKTVRNHVTNIFWKIGATTRAEAIVRAREAGIGVDTTGAA